MTPPYLIPENIIPKSLGKPKEKRRSKLDAFQAQILGLMGRYPSITAIRLHEELRLVGYTGGYSILVERIRQLRARPAKPLTIRFDRLTGLSSTNSDSTN